MHIDHHIHAVYNEHMGNITEHMSNITEHMGNITTYIIDSFTDTAFRGNPAAVCILNNQQSVEWMQNVASEFNLAETAFVHPVEKGFQLRWFSPSTEVPLCGHATLATYHALLEENILETSEETCFFTQAGPLYVHGRESANGREITMNFPAQEVSFVDISEEILAAFKNNINATKAAISSGKKDQWGIIEVAHTDDIFTLEPDFSAIAALPYVGLILSSKGPYAVPGKTLVADFISRVFVPQLGINEDPVTGAAHCCLVSYWKKRLEKEKFVAYQASKRGGLLTLELQDTSHDSRVNISGYATTVLRGILK